MCGRFELKTKFEKLPKVLKQDYPIGLDSKYETQSLIRPNDPVLYLSMLLGLGGVYVLISSFHDDDDGDDDGEKYIYNLEETYLAK